MHINQLVELFSKLVSDVCWDNQGRRESRRKGPPIDSYSAAHIKTSVSDGLGLEIAFDNLSACLVVIELFCLVISVLYHLPLKSGLLRSGVSQEVHR